MKKVILPLLVVIIGVCFGQVDPGLTVAVGSNFDIFQSGKKVGEIYVPWHEPGVLQYKQHWVLFPAYVYPSAKNQMAVEIVPKAKSPYADEADFFRRVTFARGSKYVRVTADEYSKLPAVH